MKLYDLIIIGGGPAGFFAALSATEKNPNLNILIIEKGSKVLSKVLISGGGRCNLTHACFDPADLIEYYPRGSKELRGPFTKFQPLDTIEWFKQHGVETKIEKDGRVFPASNHSSTVANCLINEVNKSNIKVYKSCSIKSVEKLNHNFILKLSDNSNLFSKSLLIAAGGNSKSAYKFAIKFGHSIIPPVPSLFTFNIKDPRLKDLLGISVQKVKLQIIPVSNKKKPTAFKSQGPLLITHWGISGPAVLKLSAWASRNLFNADYKSELIINWLPDYSQDQILKILQKYKNEKPRQQASSHAVDGLLPSRLWKNLLLSTGIQQNNSWNEISNSDLQILSKELTSGKFHITGKGVFKEEFVTCGGIKLSEVNFKTMESKLQPGLYFAGEILDIDGLTGGFNFQSAWTTGWIAGQTIGKHIQ